MSKHKCKLCNQYFYEESSIKTPCGWFCSFDHAFEFSRSKIKHPKSKKKKVILKTRLELNKKDLRWQHKQTQLAFNKMRVLQELLWFKRKGIEPVCISCRNTKGVDNWCCGHFKTRGSYTNLRYDEKNTFLQHNYRCNMQLSGDIEGTKNTVGFKKGLIERFGEEEGNNIIQYCNSNTRLIKWNCTDLEIMRKYCNKESRSIKKYL